MAESLILGEAEALYPSPELIAIIRNKTRQGLAGRADGRGSISALAFPGDLSSALAFPGDLTFSAPAHPG